MEKPSHADAASLQFTNHRRPGVERTYPVDQNAYFDTAPHRPLEHFGELLPSPIVVEDVRTQRNGFCGRFDGLEHRGVGRVSVHERCDTVARGDRNMSDVIHQASQSEEVLAPRWKHFFDAVAFYPQLGGGGLEPQSFLAQFAGQPPDPVDPKKSVQHRSQNGKQHHDAYPPHGRAIVPFVQDHVPRRDDSQKKRQGGDNERP